MSKTKRAFSAFLASAMLVALAAPAAFAAKQSTADNTDYLNCTTAAVSGVDGCSQVADGLSVVVLTVEDDADATAERVTFDLAGLTVVGTTGTGWTVVGSQITAEDDEAIDGNTITVRAPAAPGTSVIRVYTYPQGGVATEEGTLTVTWTATSGLGVSEATSVVKIVADGTPCATEANIVAATAITTQPASSGAADLCIAVNNGNSGNVETGSVTVTITPFGLVNGSQTATLALTDANDGVVKFDLSGGGLAGTATVAISVTVGSTTTTFAPRTFTWAGAVASLTLANQKYVGIAAGAASTDALKLTGKDSAGNTVAVGTIGAVAPAPAVTFTSSPAGLSFANGSAAGLFNVTCGSSSGTYTVTAKQGTVTSNPVTFICSTSTQATDTYTVAFDKANVAPGGSAQLCISVKNAAGLPVPDASYVFGTVALVSSGALGQPFGAFSNGKACATYLAPFAPGQVSAVVTPGYSFDPTSRTASITIGAPATAAGSALGVAPAGPFTTTTKVTTRGRYVTFRFDLGSAAAGKAVQILAATKTGTTWSGFTAITTRTADANGVVIYYARQSTATWKSFRAQETTTNVTPARQARWT